MNPQRSGCLFTLLLLAALVLPRAVLAIPLPKAEDIAKYKADGTWPQVAGYIDRLHDSIESRLTDGELLNLVEAGYGLPTSKSPSAASTAAPRANLDGNDVVDERDILELGYSPSKPRSASVTLPYGTASQANRPKCLVLMIKFPDQQPTDAKNQGSEFDVNHDAGWAADKWFDLSTPGDLKDASVAYYYKQASYGKLELTGDVFNNAAVCDADGWITSAYTYAEMRSIQGTHGAIVDDAISQVDAYIDFSDYDSNHDGYVDGLITIYAGPDDVFAGGDAWYFRWASDPGSATNDGVRITQGVWVSEEGYLYTFCHEFGHELGLPDLYDVGGSNSGPANDGTGMWDLMCDWDTNTGVIPPLPNAWCRTRLRFATPVDILTSGDTSITLNCATTASAQDGTVFRIWRNGGPGPEYFLMEYRNAAAGFDQNLQGNGGIMLWHADESVTTGNNRDNDFFPQRITFEPADWAYQTFTHDGDPWRSGFNGGDSKDWFDDTSSPSALDNGSSPTGVKIDPTDGPGGATMHATVHNAGSGLPSLSFQSPANSANVSGAVAFDVTSDATQRVEYYVNGCLKYVEAAPAPYDGFTWDTLSTLNGSCTLRVIAYNAGDSVRTLERSVTVVNAQNSGAALNFTDNFNGYSGGQDAALLGQWNLHGDSFGLAVEHLTIAGASSPCLAFAQSSFPAPPFNGDEEDSGSGIYEGQDDEWLMSPRINLSGYSGLQLSYKLAFRGAWSGDAVLQTQVSADNGATWDDVDGMTSIYGSLLDTQYDTGMWDPGTGNFTRFAQRTVSLEDYLNQQVYIRFLYVGGGAYGIGYAIDDFSITGTPLLLNSVSPSRATVGSSITLSGNGFGASQGSGTVRFADGSGGFVAQATVTSWSNTQIVCNVPAGAKSDPSAGIWVRNNSGVDTNARPFKVILPPPVLGGLEQR